jgi:hypothetical protein
VLPGVQLAPPSVAPPPSSSPPPRHTRNRCRANDPVVASAPPPRRSPLPHQAILRDAEESSLIEFLASKLTALSSLQLECEEAVMSAGRVRAVLNAPGRL